MATSKPRISYRCPRCREQITRLPDNHTFYTCARCRTRYRVMIDEQTNTVAFVDQSAQSGKPPLGLPKGSIRALVALAMAGVCLAIVAQGGDIPGSLASLLLTIIAFYFGYRGKGASLIDRVYDPAARRELPLYLPAGLIRTLLIAACAMTAYLLLRADRVLGVPMHLEFLFILAGLIAGHYFGKVVRGASPGVGHLKAVVALALAAVLAWVFVTGRHLSMPPHVVMLLCATISFYYGSRS